MSLSHSVFTPLSPNPTHLSHRVTTHRAQFRGSGDKSYGQPFPEEEGEKEGEGGNGAKRRKNRALCLWRRWARRITDTEEGFVWKGCPDMFHSGMEADERRNSGSGKVDCELELS